MKKHAPIAMPFYEERPGKVVINLKGRTSASSTTLKGCDEDYMYVNINAPPEDGKANKELVKFLSGFLGIKRENIQILVGHTSHTKVLALTGLDVDELIEKVKRE